MNDSTRFICLFHSSKHAQDAVKALHDAGFSEQAVSTVGDTSSSSDSTQALSDLGVPDRDLKHLQDGLRHGGVVVSLEAPETRSGDIERIFHEYSAKKIDEKNLGTTDRSDAAAAVAASAFPATTSSSRDVVGEAVLPIAEEELVVGKREVDRGGVRVFRRTVEEPVQQDVTLHGERAVLEYREVNRPATDADLRAGSQEIELVETAEVPVVQKIARVVEEVHVGKIETDRTEVIRDTLRHTEVDVEPVETEADARVRD